MQSKITRSMRVYSFDSVVISFRRIWRVETLLSSMGFGLVALLNNLRPTSSDMAMTRDETVTPSRRFFLLIREYNAF